MAKAKYLIVVLENEWRGQNTWKIVLVYEWRGQNNWIFVLKNEWRKQNTWIFVLIYEWRGQNTWRFVLKNECYSRPRHKVTSTVPPFPTGILSKSGAGGAHWRPFVVYSKVIIIIKLQ